MKRLLLIVLPLLLIVGCSSPEPINYEETLNERDDVYYTKDTNQPYSGPVFSLDKKGRNRIEGNLEDGKMITYKRFTWNYNGQKEYEETFKDGKKDGLHTRWYYNGQTKSEVTYKVGKKDGLETVWYENGQMSFKGTFKDGKKDGLVTWWYENGQKRDERNYKDGELISQKCWDEDGNDCECDDRGFGIGCK